MREWNDIMDSIFNENRYFNNDEEANIYLLNKRNEYLGIKAYEEEKYRDSLFYYDIFLDEIAYLLEKGNYKSSLEYSIALGFLIDNGYLSDNFTFEAGVSDKELTSKYGISIVSGRGCCRNIVDVHRDIFDRLNIDILPFYCYQGISFLSKPINKPANHVISLIGYNDNMYGIDLYNNSLLYYFKEPFVMNSISTYYNGSLRYKPYYEYILDGTSLEELKKRASIFSKYVGKRISSMEYEDEIKFEVFKNLQNNEASLDRFFDKNKVLKKEIIRGLEKS